MPTNTRPSRSRATTATSLLEPHELSTDELALMHQGDTATETRPGTPTGTPTGTQTESGADTQQGGTAPAPTVTPPGATPATSAVRLVAAGVAITGQKVTALWSDQSPRNSWMYLETAGWKKLAGLGDTGSTAMTLLAAHARATGTAPVVDENPAGTASVLYVW